MDLTGLTHDSLAAKIIAYVFYSVAYIAVGHPVLINTAKNIAKGKIFDENFLMTIASIGAIALGIFAGDGFAEGVAVMLLYQLGELLQAAASARPETRFQSLCSLKATLQLCLKTAFSIPLLPRNCVAAT